MNTQTAPKWKDVWARGFAPQLSTNELMALETLLAGDDKRLLQRCTSYPPFLPIVPFDSDHNSKRVECGCPLTMCRYVAGSIATVGEAEASLRELSDGADRLCADLGPAATRFLLNHIDDTPRAQMIRDLLPLVQAALAERRAVVA
jgi:hypothetical protein